MLLAIMWSSISNVVTSFGQKKDSATTSQVCHEFLDDDDEICSYESSDEGLECPICWESFNIVENVPYVLWCGHTICKNCLLGLKWAALKFSMHQIQIPLFISCPWCNLLTLRLLYNGNIKFPTKNFFLLWMVESRNGDRAKSLCGDHQTLWSLGRVSGIGNNTTAAFPRPRLLGNSRSSSGAHSDMSSSTSQRPQFSLHKSLDFFIHLASKFPLVIILMLVIFAIIPSSIAIIMAYLVLTVLFALPCFLVLYFSYPALDWLAREIAS